MLKPVYILFLSLFVVSIFSCKDDEDEFPPTVVFETPQENDSFKVLESVFIKARITDDENIERVIVRLIDNNSGNVALPSQTFTPNTKTFELDFVVELSDSLLESGSYYFQVEANDGTNTFSDFRTVHISGIAKRQLSTVVACSNLQSTDIYEGSSTNGYQLFQTLASSYEDMVLNNDDQHLWYLSENTKEIQVFALIDKERLYNQRINSSFANPFTNLVRDDRDVILGIKDGEVEGFNQFFNDNFTYRTQNDRVIGRVDVDDDFVLVEELDRDGNNRSLLALNKSSRFLVNSVNLPGEPTNMFVHRKDKVLVFYNTAQNGVIAEFDLVQSGLRTIRSLNNKINAVEQINTNEYVLSTSVNVQSYQVANNNLVTYLNEPNAVLSYDDLQNQLYVGVGLELKQYTYRSNVVNATSIFSKEIVGIDIRYNKNGSP